LIEYGEFERLGGQKTLRVDVRIIAATNGDLQQLASENKFREDLLDRLSFDVIHLPALSQRSEDIPELAQHFAVQMCAELGWEFFPGFTPEALEALAAYSWPGNVRELKNVVERSLYRWGDPDSAVGELVLDPFRSPYDIAPSEANFANTAQVESEEETQVVPGFSERTEIFEKNILQQTLAEHGNNQRLTAQALQLSYDQLRGLLKKYGLTGARRGRVDS